MAPRAAPAYIGIDVGAAASELDDDMEAREEDADAMAEEAADRPELLAELICELKCPAAAVAELYSARRELCTFPVAVAIILLIRSMPAEAMDWTEMTLASAEAMRALCAAWREVSACLWDVEDVLDAPWLMLLHRTQQR